MSVAADYPHIQKTDDRPAHLLRFPRIRVAQIVMDYLGHGWSPDEMCRQHPFLGQQRGRESFSGLRNRLLVTATGA